MPHRFVWGLLLLLVGVVRCQLQVNSITATNYSMSSPSIYTVEIYRYTTTPVPLECFLVLTFDNAYANLISSPSCSSTDFGATVLGCSYAGTKLTVANLFSNSSYLNIVSFQITITGVTNPTPAKDYISINAVQIINGASATVDSGSSSYSIAIVPLSAKCSTSVLNNFVFSNGTLSISYTSGYIQGSINSSYWLNITMANYYPDDTTQTLIGAAFSQSVLATQPAGSEYVYSIGYVTDFTIKMLMPPSSRAESGFITITSSTVNNGGTIDSCSISLSGMQPNNFTKLVLSSGVVQSYGGVQFDLKLPTPLISGDQLQITFPAAFDLSKVVGGSVAIAGYNSFAMAVYNGNMVVLTVSLTQAVLYAELIFSIGSVGLPFTTAAQTIAISLLTADNYYRINQTYQYSALAGSLGVSVSCLSVQIGAVTNCVFALTTSHYIKPNATVQIALPTGFPVASGSANCGVSGSGLNTYASCIYNGLVNTITATGISASTATLSPMSLSLNVSMTMSYQLGNYSLGLSTLSNGASVDAGTVNLVTVSRKLTSSQLVIASSSSTTYSPTTYTVSLFAPFDQGYVYTVLLTVPTDVQAGLVPSVTNAIFNSYSNFTVNMSDSNLVNTSFTIGGLMTAPSLQPYTISIEIYYMSALLFYGSQSVAMTALKSINTLTMDQSNQIVFSPFTASFVISDLVVGDTIRLSAPFTYFYSTNQTNCSTAVVTCQAGGTLKVVSVGNSGSNLTSFTVALVNQAFIGSYAVTVTVYDSLNVYGKQSSSMSMSVTVSNTIGVVASQSNPYLNESSVYTFNLTFTTPNASYLMSRVSSNFTILSPACNVNCGAPMVVSGGYLFSLTSSWAVVSFSVVNPVQFNSFSKFTFQTSSNDGDKDYGSYQPSLVCAAPCRSCSSANSSLCLSCYAWSSYPYLYHNNCLSVCPGGTFAGLNGSVAVCSDCLSSCSSCSLSSSNCTGCVSGYFMYQYSCLGACPSDTFVVNGSSSCSGCLSPCSSCSVAASNCTGCMISYGGTLYYYLQNSCYAQSCPETYYSSLTNNSCYKCGAPCYGCTAAVCLSCVASYLLYNGGCYGVCPNGTFASNGSVCSVCAATCSVCSSLAVCSGCLPNYYLLNGSCVSNCPAYFYVSGVVCSACVWPCLLCNATGCLTCSDASNYLSGQSCVTACAAPLHPNNASMVCELCVPPCSSCSWSTACLTCISTYSLLNSSCLAACPGGYYSYSGVCQSCPSTCSVCSYVNQQILCTSCVNGNLIYGYQCVGTCPNSTQASGQYCSSSSCGSLDHCLSCSGYICLQCNSLYTLNANYTCTEMVSSSAVLSALSQVAVPFPFLIAIIMVIVISFFLKHNYGKMFSPLFIYALAGVLEELCLVMWTTLALLWNANVVYPLPMVSVVYATILIVIGYGVMNGVQFVCWLCRIERDKKYRQWERQNNRCASVLIAVLSLLFSFRLDAIKFSKTGHSERLSARLQSPEVFAHYSVLAIIAILINAASIVVSVYILYLQSSLNYLFFSCIEVAIVSVLMLTLSIVMLCIPREQLIEDKGDYRLGHDNDQLEGPSLQEIMSGLGVVQQEQNFHKEACFQSGSVFVRKNQTDDSNSQNLAVLEQESSKKEDNDGVLFNQEEGAEGACPINRSPKNQEASNQQDTIFMSEDAVQSDNHILIDQISVNKAEALALTRIFLPEETNGKPVFFKQSGLIVKQRLQQLPQQCSEPELIGQYQDFEINQSLTNYFNEPLTTNQQARVVQRQFAQKVNFDKSSQKQGQVTNQKIGKEQNVRRFQKTNQQMGQKDEKYIQKKSKIDKRQRISLNQNILKQTIKQKNSNNTFIMANKGSNVNPSETKKQLQKLNQLSQILKQMERQQLSLRNKQLNVQNQQQNINQLKDQKLRQRKELIQMQIEDQLSMAAHIFQAMKGKNQNKKRKIISKQGQLGRENVKKLKEEQIIINYQNNDEINLRDQLSPKKIKVSPQPQLSQYKKKHIFIEQQGQILSDNSDLEDIYIINNQTQRNKNSKKEISGRGQEQSSKNYKEKKQKRSQGEKDGQNSTNLIRYQKQSNKFKNNSNQQAFNQQTAINYQEYKKQFEFTEEQYDKIEEIDHFILEVGNQQNNEKETEYKIQQQNQITVYNDDIIEVEQSEQSMQNNSENTHWPIEPELEEKLAEIDKKADFYLRNAAQQEHESLERGQYVYQTPTQEIYEEEEEQEEQNQDKTINDIVFQEKEEIAKLESMSRSSTKKRFPRGRVNRRVIDLAPER